MSAIFCKRPRLLCQSIVLSLENARCHTPNLTAVYGCTSDKVWISPGLVLSILSLTESLRVIAIDDVKQVATSWLQTLDNSAFPWNISLGTIVEQISRW